MSTTAPKKTSGSTTQTDLDALRAAGGGNIPENQAPPQKMTNPTFHYTMCIGLTVLGLATLVLGILGWTGTAFLKEAYPWLIAISLFFTLPGLVGLYRGPGVPSTHVIPRPKNRKPIDYAAGAGGAAGPTPSA